MSHGVFCSHVCNLFCCKLFLLPSSDILSPHDIVRNVWYMISRFYGHGVLLGGFWFLKALFWSSIISYVFLKIFKNTWVCICLSITIGYLFFINDFTIPFVGISNEVFIYSVFYLLGYLFSSSGTALFNIKNSIGSVVILFIATIYWPQTMCAAQFSSILPYFVSAILTIWTIYSFACNIYLRIPVSFLNKLVDIIGNHTLTILALHFISFKLVSYFIILTNNLPIERLSEHPVMTDYSGNGWRAAYFVIGVTLPLVAVWISQYIISFLKNRYAVFHL